MQSLPLSFSNSSVYLHSVWGMMYCDVPDFCQRNRKNGEHIPMVIKTRVQQSLNLIWEWSVLITISRKQGGQWVVRLLCPFYGDLGDILWNRVEVILIHWTSWTKAIRICPLLSSILLLLTQASFREHPIEMNWRFPYSVIFSKLLMMC